MKKDNRKNRWTIMLAAIAACFVFTSCSDDVLPSSESIELPSSWNNNRPVLDLTRSFSSVIIIDAQGKPYRNG